MQHHQKDFLKKLSWLNPDSTEYMLSFYGLRSTFTNKPELHLLNDLIIPIKISCTQLFEDSRNYTIDIWDVHFSNKLQYNYIEEIIKQGIKEIQKNRNILVWCMFEGGFVDGSRLFNEWEINLTYAICLPNNEPKIFLGDKIEDQKEVVFEEVNKYLRNVIKI
jgi:hypothetical protein